MRSTEVVLNTTKLIQEVHDRLCTVQSMQKSCIDQHRSDLEFHVEDLVLLKVLPQTGVIRFQKRCKLGPRFIGPFRVIIRVDKLAYRSGLAAELSQIHNTFHVSQLQKCLVDDSVVVPLANIQVDQRMNYVEKLVAILDRKTKTLHKKVVILVKVQWQHLKGCKWN